MPANCRRQMLWSLRSWNLDTLPFIYKYGTSCYACIYSAGRRQLCAIGVHPVGLFHHQNDVQISTLQFAFCTNSMRSRWAADHDSRLAEKLVDFEESWSKHVENTQSSLGPVVQSAFYDIFHSDCESPSAWVEFEIQMGNAALAVLRQRYILLDRRSSSTRVGS